MAGIGATAILAAMLSGLASAFAAELVFVGVPLFGPAPWEIDVIEHHNLAAVEDLQIEIVDIGGKLVPPVALETEATDFVMTDHLFISQQRWQGADYTFVPHTKLGGNLIARSDSGITAIEDLDGKSIAIANGISEHSWLLFRAYSRAALETDIGAVLESITKVSSPSLLSDPIRSGAVNAVVNEWQPSVRLRHLGNRQILSIDDTLDALGLADQPAIHGWAFRESFAQEYPDIAMGFLRVSLEARRILLTSDAEWDRLRLSLPVQDEAELVAMREAYRAAIITSYGTEQRIAAEQFFDILRREGGVDYVAGTEALAPGTFFVMGDGPRPDDCAPICTWDGIKCVC